MDKTTLLGNIISIDNFDVYDDEGTKVFDGSNIVGMIADKAWFRIKRQDMFMDSFYNPNNRSIQYYLNLVKMYNFSLFANGVIFATALPTGVPYDSISYADESVSTKVGTNKTISLVVNPTRANATISYESGNTEYYTVAADSSDDRKCVITPVAAGTATLTATTGTGDAAKTATISVTITNS